MDGVSLHCIPHDSEDSAHVRMAKAGGEGLLVGDHKDMIISTGDVDHLLVSKVLTARLIHQVCF